MVVHCDLHAIRRNLDSIRTTTRARIRLTVKADCYGLGDIAEYLEEDVDSYAVATMEEAITLKRRGVSKPILLLTPTEDVKKASAHDVTVSVHSVDTASALRCAPDIHIALNTGMNRYGVTRDSLPLVLNILDGARVTGAYTHVYGAPYAMAQMESFLDMLAPIRERFPTVTTHVSASSMLPDTLGCDEVRIGLAAYLPSGMSITSTVLSIQSLSEGDRAGYDGVFRATRPSLIATVRGGYADGLPRAMRGSHVIVGNVYCPIVAVCMDCILVDVTDVDAHVGDTVVIIGSRGGLEVTPEDIARHLHTIPYEVLAHPRPRARRIVYD